eukprot:796375-Pyramimonas_sp.AAC.1
MRGSLGGHQGGGGQNVRDAGMLLVKLGAQYDMGKHAPDASFKLCASGLNYAVWVKPHVNAGLKPQPKEKLKMDIPA